MEKLKKILSNLPHPIRWAFGYGLGFCPFGHGACNDGHPRARDCFSSFLGLSILALEIKWARELNQQGMQGLERIVAKLKSIFGKKNKGETN
jgi:hypothetical protein